MCGIAGFFASSGEVSEQNLHRLATALAHRGPDGSHVFPYGSVGMVHTRLAIIDVAGGQQPFEWPDGLVLVANGEVYNDPVIRRTSPDMPFHTGSDCESLLALYKRYGESFVSHVRGMVAFALYDSVNDLLFLGRDAFGIKPLYIVEGEGGVAFASEIPPLIAAGYISPYVNPRKAFELFNLQFTTGEQTIIQGVRRVLPGETLVIKAGRLVRHIRCSSPLTPPASEGHPSENSIITSEEEALRTFETAFMDSVHVHQRADVPYGLFLSGGLDSTALLAAMARQRECPVLAFTAGFPGTQVHDERSHARSLAREVGAEHVEVTVSEDDFWTYLPRIVGCMDDPAADYAIIPTWFLARAASSSVKVILSGEGGDEIFAGYGRYRAALRPWPFARPMRQRGLCEGLGLFQRRDTSWRDDYETHEAVLQKSIPDKLLRCQQMDGLDWLPHNLLAKLDRCLMAHGVEGRVPFLDPAVARLGARLHPSLKIRRGLGKYVLRCWLQKNMPNSGPFAPKRGFTVPVGEWMARQGHRLAPSIASSESIKGLVNPSAVSSLFQASGKRERFAAWVLLFYDLWHRHHIQGQPVEGDVFHVLSS